MDWTGPTFKEGIHKSVPNVGGWHLSASILNRRTNHWILATWVWGKLFDHIPCCSVGDALGIWGLRSFVKCRCLLRIVTSKSELLPVFAGLWQPLTSSSNYFYQQKFWVEPGSTWGLVWGPQTFIFHFHEWSCFFYRMVPPVCTGAVCSKEGAFGLTS